MWRLCLQLYLLFLFLRVLLSWFPAFGWDKQPWLALRQVCSENAFSFVRQQGKVDVQAV